MKLSVCQRARLKTMSTGWKVGMEPSDNNQTDRNLGFKKASTGMWSGKTDSGELHSRMTLLFKLTVSRSFPVEAMCPSLSEGHGFLCAGCLSCRLTDFCYLS